MSRLQCYFHSSSTCRTPYEIPYVPSSLASPSFLKDHHADTGDRPYKCQHCGDQFARSDLLSRHVNKCHSAEKPSSAPNNRRKGSTSAARATTSKQACDQCVITNLPCDGSNPCCESCPAFDPLTSLIIHLTQPNVSLASAVALLSNSTVRPLQSGPVIPLLLSPVISR